MKEKIIEILEKHKVEMTINVDSIGHAEENNKGYRTRIADEIIKQQNAENISIPLWQFKEIEDALRTTNNIYKLYNKETAYDRAAFKAYCFASKALENHEKDKK